MKSTRFSYFTVFSGKRFEAHTKSQKELLESSGSEDCLS